eukprot:gene30780-35819_t
MTGIALVSNFLSAMTSIAPDIMPDFLSTMTSIALVVTAAYSKMLSQTPEFLAAMTSIAPDIMVTAAYGNMLPQAFLDIPKYGTLNVHPSLLPKYRGAAPVQRALEDGVRESGVSVAYTVFKCDAGPVLAQKKFAVDADVQQPELLAQLFELGADLLLSKLPEVFEGKGEELATPQDESQVLHAAKLTKEDSILDFSLDAVTLHNKVRGYAGWPGTSASFVLEDTSSGKQETISMKVLKTKVAPASIAPSPSTQDGEVHWGSDDSMIIPCAGGTSWLQVLQVQPPTKKAMPTKSYKNGVQHKKIAIA